jgi:hypothetical protein
MEAENGRGTTLVLGGLGKTGGRVAGRPDYACEAAATGVWDAASRKPADLPG